jgi:hypothetical protein
LSDTIIVTDSHLLVEKRVSHRSLR